MCCFATLSPLFTAPDDPHASLQPALWAGRLWLDGGLTCNVPRPRGHTTWAVSPRGVEAAIRPGRCTVTARPGAGGGAQVAGRDYGLFSLLPSCSDDCEVVQQVLYLSGSSAACGTLTTFALNAGRLRRRRQFLLVSLAVAGACCCCCCAPTLVSSATPLTHSPPRALCCLMRRRSQTIRGGQRCCCSLQRRQMAPDTQRARGRSC